LSPPDQQQIAIRKKKISPIISFFSGTVATPASKTRENPNRLSDAAFMRMISPLKDICSARQKHCLMISAMPYR